MATRGKYVKWNQPRAIKTVKRCVKESPTDLKAAFQKAAEELNTTASAVYSAWHGIIKHKTRGYATRTVKSAKVETPVVVEVEKSEPEQVSVPVKTKKQTTTTPIYEVVVSTQEVEGMRVVTVRQYFPI